jgi:hypothetical protein
MKINREKFYKEYRNQFGSLRQTQVDYLNALLDAVEADTKYTMTIPQLAYILSTVKHETAHTYRPLREYGRGRRRKYGRPVGPYGHTYYGRGYVQLTWKYNYESMSKVVGHDLVKSPDLALRPDIAYIVLVDGMLNGTYNGRKHGLAHYINDHKKDYYTARRTVNILDKASLLAKYARKFEKVLDKSATI